MSQSWPLQYTHNAPPPTVSIRLHCFPHLRSWHWRRCPHRSRSCWPPWQLPLHIGYRDWNRGGMCCQPHTETWICREVSTLILDVSTWAHPKLSLNRQLQTVIWRVVQTNTKMVHSFLQLIFCSHAALQTWQYFLTWHLSYVTDFIYNTFYISLTYYYCTTCNITLRVKYLSVC